MVNKKDTFYRWCDVVYGDTIFLVDAIFTEEDGITDWDIYHEGVDFTELLNEDTLTDILIDAEHYFRYGLRS